MKKLVVFFLLQTCALIAYSQQIVFSKLTGPYLGEDPPGLTAKLFAPAIVSTNLYVTFKMKDGKWSRGINLGNNVNTTRMEHWPSLTPDGKYLFFSSDRLVEIQYGYSVRRISMDEIKALHDFYYLPKHGGDIYWVEAKFIEALRPIERT